jgi:hypothetical protein
MDPEVASDLESLLLEYDGLEHIKVKKWGKSLTLHSVDQHGPQNHARFTSLGAGQWGLSLPRHTGRWEKTPFTGPIEELLDTLVQNFGFYLEQYP